jgi:hypothetical protein
LACSGSPQQIDQAIQQQGKQLHELLQLFRQANTEPLASCILQTPKNKDNTIQMKPKKKSITETATKSIQRKSPGLQDKEGKNKSILMKAQVLVARKYDILEEDKEMNSMTLQQYLNMYKSPLSEEAMEAITQLFEVAAKKKKGKKKKKCADDQDKRSKKNKNPSKVSSSNAARGQPREPVVVIPDDFLLGELLLSSPFQALRGQASLACVPSSSLVLFFVR